MMPATDWFDDVPTLGKMDPHQAAAKLNEVGEGEAASALESSGEDEPVVFGILDWFRGETKPWQHTSHSFGFLPPTRPGKKPVAIEHAGNIDPDPTLKKSAVKVTLQGLRVADYPGSGDHRILFDFYAQNQVSGTVEHLHFASTYRAREGQRAAVVGYPIFLGLNVGTEGLAFRCFTVNVKNDQDESFLKSLESDVLKSGLKVATTLSPVIGQLSSLTLAMTKNLAKRHRNVPVQDFYLGLDFANMGSGARLREGLYIAVQVPETSELAWNWDEWVYLPSAGEIVSKEDQKTLIPYNYIAFGVSRYEP